MEHADDRIHAARAVVEPSPAIDLTDADAIAAWCTDLDVSEQVLRDAVRMVGVMPNAVRFFVQGSRRHINEPSPAAKASQLATRASRSLRTHIKVVSQPERQAKPLDLERLVVELRTGCRGDVDFACGVARLCATLADRTPPTQGEKPGAQIRRLFGIP